MWDKFIAGLGVFRKGEAVADAVRLKNTAALGGLVAALFASLLTLAKAFGHPVDIDQGTLENLAAGMVGLLGLWNAYAHVAGNNDIGLPEHVNETLPPVPVAAAGVVPNAARAANRTASRFEPVLPAGPEDRVAPSADLGLNDPSNQGNLG